MRPIYELLRELADPETTDLALATGRMPSVKQNGAFVPIERAPVSEAELAAALQEIGGSPHLAKLGEKPVSWNTAIDGLGVVAIVALRRGGILQARLVLKKGEDSVAPEPPSSSHLAAAKPVEATPTSNVSARSPRSGQSAETSTGPEGNLVTSLPDALFAILEAARSQRATDVHVVADRPTSFRKSGALVPQGSPISAANAAAMLHGIVPARLEPVFERAGSCDFALADARLGRFRVNVARQRTGIKGCFRLISREVPALTSLGLPPSLVEAVQHHHGLVLVTGPTGSGKSTTLAALIDLLNRETSHHIITIEDPIEHVHTPKKALLSQREVGSHTRSFETALKGALRQDPDVIVVGELRDTETVRMALVASETGHLVLATMNTPSASKTIDRLIDLFPPGDQGQVRMSLAGGLRMIVGQRLVPTQDGGLVAAAETLPGCVPLWALIRDGRTFQIPSLQQRGKQLGIVRLDEQLQELVRGGRISMDAARFVAESPEFGRTA